VNPDRALVAQFLHGSREPLALASNPLARDLNGSLLQLDEAAGVALLAFEPPERFLQGAQLLQGGISATLLDFAMAFAAHAKLAGAGSPQSFATASLTVHLLRPAPSARYLVRGRIVRMGGKLAFAEGHMAREGDERPYASASAVLALLDA
jgi:uncharacterized protein (TIGR00369 family)